MRLCCSTRGEIKIDGTAPAVDAPVKISPAAIDFHLRFIDMPRAKVGRVTPVPAQPFFYLRRITLNPTVNCGVIDIHPTLSQHLLQFTVADAVFAIPAYRPQDDVTLKMTVFEWVHVQLRQQKVTISLSPPDFCNSAGRYAVALSEGVNGIYLSRTSLDVAFDDKGRQVKPLTAHLTGNVAGMIVLLEGGGWQVSAESVPAPPVLSDGQTGSIRKMINDGAAPGRLQSDRSFS